MAGVSVGETPDNPVAINVTAMVDVIFCLCVFFMCSLHFREVEGRFETWLPRSGHEPGTAAPITEMRVALFRDEADERTVRQYGQRVVETDEELATLIEQSHADLLRVNKPGMPLTIDAEARVPWDDVMDVINIGKSEAVERIEFAMGAPPPR